MRIRRRMLKGALAAVAAGMLTPLRALAARWAKPAFESNVLNEALHHLFGASETTPSASIRIIAPYYVENGASVRCEVTTSLPEVDTIAVLVEKNPQPLAMALQPKGAQPYLSLQIKMWESSNVFAVVSSRGRLYSARQNINVTVGMNESMR